MKHVQFKTMPRTTRSGPSIVVLVLLVVSALAVASVPPSHAGPGSEAVPSAGEPAAAGSSQESNHTVYLPALFRGYSAEPVYPDSAFGVHIFDMNLTLGTQLVDMGAQWVRTRLNWGRIEPVNTDPENYDWQTGLERQLRHMADGGVNIVLTLMDNPDWAATNPGGPVDKVDMDELIEFMVAAVERYSAPPYEVKYWEFYNEPDNGVASHGEAGNVGYFGHQPEAYVALLQAVYEPIKAVDPEAQITFGGIAYDNFDDPGGGPFVKTFLDEVLANGGGDYFDVMNFHYYPAFAWYWEGEVPGAIDILAKYSYIRDKLASYGVHKPFVCTEASKWSADIPPGGVEAQSRYVAQMFSRSMAAGFHFTTWWTFYDIGGGTDTTGLLDADFEPKPAYLAYQTLDRQLGGAAYVRTWTEAETGAPAMVVEVYEFEPGLGVTWPDGAARILAAWTNDETEHTLVVPVASLVQVDKYGGETQVYDGDDGQVDGLIHLALGPSPVYLRLPE
jgi:hypothetical protein